jgi:hypothetical protein
MLDISSKNLASKLSSLFSEYLSERQKLLSSAVSHHMGSSVYDDWWDYDDGYGEWWESSFQNPSCHNNHIDDDDYYPSYKKSVKKSKRGGKRTHSKKSKNIDSDVKILFYDDITDCRNVREFNSLYEFEEFMDSENIYISSSDQANLLKNKVTHCCKDPNFKSFESPWLITDSTYGGLRWLCASDEEELVNYYG